MILACPLTARVLVSRDLLLNLEKFLEEFNRIL